MRRARLALLAALLVSGAGCSRPSSSESSPEPTSKAVVDPSSASSTTEAPLASAGPVLTPEDVEAETEQRITEQNLESELDRLEREIQAE